MAEYTAETEHALREAGWTPRRKVGTSDMRHQLEQWGFTMSETAERFLSEFSGLVFPYNGPGITRARERIEFNPLLIGGEDDRCAVWSEDIGEILTPIGELARQWDLAISESGEIFTVADTLDSFGSGEEALENLILGVMPRDISLKIVDEAESSKTG
ncbi:SUKH-3 immunity protein [Penicillium daleae]|uniref:SUKH-3 immunity protein n=1 Tax=Penicillium daleae TaxID=63821 RepID=A0AAD6CGF7_9EURO|nr:SUKH-3 immunity protein [Penicillium daleae]KAJ5465034.1 SUKH-3 immunity protein [Penicillium daleae]